MIDGCFIEFYIKDGGFIIYNLVFVLILDYDFVVIILVVVLFVENEVIVIDIRIIFLKLLEFFLFGIEEVGKDEVVFIYGGIYWDELINLSIILILDDGLGFNISLWIVRGVDVIGLWFGFSFVLNLVFLIDSLLCFWFYLIIV